jgi:hypothetical protein
LGIWNRGLSDDEVAALYSGGSGRALIPLPLPGDANGDHNVDLSDFGILKANFAIGTRRAEGDVNGDGQVDLNDFGILKDNFGRSAAAPEPSSWLMVLAGAASVYCAFFRRWRSSA